jgi:hypothetical protein
MPPKKDKKKGSSKASSSGSAEGPLVQLRPSQILYTYGKVLPYFSGCGRTLAGTLDAIASGSMRPADLPAIAVVSAEVEAGAPLNARTKPSSSGGAPPSPGCSSSDDEGGRGKRGGGRAAKRRGGGGGAKKNKPETETRFYSTNNRRLWVLRECEARGLLGEEGTVGVRLTRPDVSKRMVEKGTRSFRVERATDAVKILDVDVPDRPGEGFREESAAAAGTSLSEGEESGEEERGEEEERTRRGEPSSGRTVGGDRDAVSELAEEMEDFHPVLRPFH